MIELSYFDKAKFIDEYNCASCDKKNEIIGTVFKEFGGIMVGLLQTNKGHPSFEDMKLMFASVLEEIIIKIIQI